MRFLVLFALNVVLTVLECGLFGPAAQKLDSFGLRGWAARAPFYFLPLYTSFFIWEWRQLRDSYLRSAFLGLMFALPLSMWVIAARCPPIEAGAHAAIGLIQGLVLARVAR